MPPTSRLAVRSKNINPKKVVMSLPKTPYGVAFQTTPHSTYQHLPTKGVQKMRRGPRR